MKNKNKIFFFELSLFFLLLVPFHFCHHVGKPNVPCSLLGRVIEDYITVGLQYSVVETRIPVARRLKFLEA